MKLAVMLEKEGLLPFLVPAELKSINRLKISSYEKVEDGYIITLNKNTFKVLLEKHKTYTGNDVFYQKNTYCYEKGRMGFLFNPMEKGEPKVAIIIRHALMRKYQQTLQGR